MPRKMYETKVEEELPGEQDKDAPTRPSRSAVKRRAELAEKVGHELTLLPREKLDVLPLSEETKDAIVHYTTITARGGGRRQLQYIGRLMRDVDLDAVLAAMEAEKAGDREEARRFQRAEDWRGRLLDDPDEIDAFVRDVAGADRDVLANLVQKAKREAKGSDKMTHRRALFRYVRDLL
jgi:ribosome-associated protein